jgi:hypothetical protein
MSRRAPILTISALRPHPGTAAASHGGVPEAALAADAELTVQLRNLADHRALELVLVKLRRKRSAPPPTAAEFDAAPRSEARRRFVPALERETSWGSSLSGVGRRGEKLGDR